ncbi:MAG: hypothetical protein JWR16_1335 [Nevskia sp.]|nr:hypothetical protein [Nevskia sp.]
MIHLDANVLVALPDWAVERHPLLNRVARGEAAAVCSLAWYEYSIGPVDEDERLAVREFIRDNIVAFDDADAALAAHLYNAVGRKRALKTDACLAACAIRADADFLTLNVDDFRPFSAHGLRLLEVSRR